MTDDDFLKQLFNLVQKGLDKKVDVHKIIGLMEIMKSMIINKILGVEDECE